MTHWIRTAAVLAAGATGLFAYEPSTPASVHLTRASELEARAEKLMEKADRHDAKANEMASRKGYNPMAHKWPAMVQGPIHRERELAEKARKAAAESRELAFKHREMSKQVAEE